MPCRASRAGCQRSCRALRAALAARSGGEQKEHLLKRCSQLIGFNVAGALSRVLLLASFLPLFAHPFLCYGVKKKQYTKLYVGFADHCLKHEKQFSLFEE